MKRAIITAVFVLVLAGCSGDPNEQANKLFIEAQQLIEKSQKQNADEQVTTLSIAQEKLNVIVAKYPAANLAVQLASGQNVGTISLKSVTHQLAEALRVRGNRYLQEKEFDSAISDFTAIIEASPDDLDSYLSRGWAYSNIGKPDRAIENYSEALRLSPKNAEVWGRRGILYGTKRDFDRAISDYYEAIRLDPNNGNYYQFRGAAYEAAGRKAEAIADFRTALAFGKSNDRIKDALERLGAAVR